MVTVLPRSETLDLVLATWRPKGDEDRFDIPNVHVFEDCECEEDWHIPIAEAQKKPACDCGCGGKCTGAGGCSGGSCKGASKGATRAKKRGSTSPTLATANTPTPDVQWVGLSQPLERSPLTHSSSSVQATTDDWWSEDDELLAVTDFTMIQNTVGANSGVTADGEPCQVNVTSPPPAEYAFGSPEWLDWWNGCFPNGPIGPDAGCDLDMAYLESLATCCEEKMLDAILNERDTDGVVCNSNWVPYAWINEDCSVAGAACGISSAGWIFWAVGVVVVVGLAIPGSLSPDQPIDGSNGNSDPGTGSTGTGTGSSDPGVSQDNASGESLWDAFLSGALSTPSEDTSSLENFDFGSYYDGLSPEDQATMLAWYEMAIMPGNSSYVNDADFQKKLDGLEESCLKGLADGIDTPSCMGFFAAKYAYDLSDRSSEGEDEATSSPPVVEDTGSGFVDVGCPPCCWNVLC